VSGGANAFPPRLASPPPLPPLVLVSRADSASVTIRDALLDMGGWEEVGAFHGLPVRRRGSFLMVEVAPLHLECDLVDRALREQGWSFDSILVASRHRAESGKPALTIHPIGNYNEAEYGGQRHRCTPSAPIEMSRILRRLQAEAQGLKHAVTFEATHHGPLLETPTCFVEIGTDESAWTNPDLGRRVARAILAADEPQAGDDAPVLIGIGGSHYAPKFGDLVKQRKANFGHIVPSYQFDAGIEPESIFEAARQTPGCAGYYLDPRSFSAPPEQVLQVFGALELGWFKDEDLA
jgi:D-aminoacyl-tRNA deacylase